MLEIDVSALSRVPMYFHVRSFTEVERHRPNGKVDMRAFLEIRVYPTKFTSPGYGISCTCCDAKCLRS